MKIRASMEKGKFELALKYLFFKHIVFNGREFETSQKSPPLTIEEVRIQMHKHTKHNGSIPSNLIAAFQYISLYYDNSRSKIASPLSSDSMLVIDTF